MSTTRDDLEARLPFGDWLGVTQLAKRWHIAPTTVRAIPFQELPYKTFGKSGRRRYREDWVKAYEESPLRQAAA